jgi:hypothetical protein
MFPPTVHLLYLFWHDSLHLSLLGTGRRLFHRWNLTPATPPRATVRRPGYAVEATEAEEKQEKEEKEESEELAPGAGGVG